MSNDRRILLFRYISILAKEFAEEKSYKDERDILLEKLGSSHDQVIKEAAEVVLESYGK